MRTKISRRSVGVPQTTTHQTLPEPSGINSGLTGVESVGQYRSKEDKTEVINVCITYSSKENLIV